MLSLCLKKINKKKIKIDKISKNDIMFFAKIVDGFFFAKRSKVSPTSENKMMWPAYAPSWGRIVKIKYQDDTSSSSAKPISKDAYLVLKNG